MTVSLHLVCPHCQTTIRVPSERLAQGPRCGQCHQAVFNGHPIELTAATFAKQLEPRVRFAKINTESEQDLGARFNIRSIPTMKLFLHGKEVASQSGAMSVQDIVRWVKSVVPSAT